MTSLTSFFFFFFGGWATFPISSPVGVVENRFLHTTSCREGVLRNKSVALTGGRCQSFEYLKACSFGVVQSVNTTFDSSECNTGC